MIRQGHIMILAPIRREQVTLLRSLLATLNAAPGQADPLNHLVPFARFENIHVARFVILEDQTLVDRRSAYPDVQFPEEKVYLSFIADCDGAGEELLKSLVKQAGDGLRQIFRHCEGMEEEADLLTWMQARNVEAATYYVNWVGRTVRQVREEARLHDRLQTLLVNLRQRSPVEAHRTLREAVLAGGLKMTPVAGRNILDILRGIAGLLYLPLIGLVLLPFIILGAPLFFIILRRKETSDPVITPRIDGARIRTMSAREDHDVTNPFSAIGSLKPGAFRRCLTKIILYTVNWSTAYIYTRGRLARVGTIHFARWVLLDDDRRVVFASNYDGSLESYMDDFINKVAFGLNLVFSNGIGYPATDFLISGGATREHEFKNFLRRHQVPTDVWYKAYPGLTTRDLARNARIREGLERRYLNAEEASRWLAEI
jgi:hypothetical protein